MKSQMENAMHLGMFDKVNLLLCCCFFLIVEKPYQTLLVQARVQSSFSEFTTPPHKNKKKLLATPVLGINFHIQNLYIYNHLLYGPLPQLPLTIIRGLCHLHLVIYGLSFNPDHHDNIKHWLCCSHGDESRWTLRCEG